MSETTIVGYCRACGKALPESEVYRSHGAMYCKEHAPLEGAAQSPYTTPAAPPPVTNHSISPGVAFVLGLIPGVGAIYNEQYAKGVIHVAIIGLLISILSNDAAAGFSPLVALMMIAFWAYMPFEAYHTAHKRMLGYPVNEVSGFANGTGVSTFPAAAVILVALGIVLLLNNLDLLDLRRALRYWPVLLIGAGLYMLYNRFAVSNGSNPGKTQQQ